ncbi:MAG: hypothetical protein NC133_03190 [Prevotella sp.]|nr:hypothetical protein [Prevotella sp.]
MQDQDFVTYEYKTVSTKAKDLNQAIDLYEAFGWEVTGTTTAFGNVTIALKRDRKQKHKLELNKLERQAEATWASIDGLHRSKTLGASVFGWIFGTVATLVFGGGMCLTLLMSNLPALVGGVALGALGIILGAVNYPIYKKWVAKKTKQILPVIDQTNEKFGNLLEQGNDLLHADRI